MRKKRGMSYRKRVAEINRIYEQYARSGLSNREIWRRHIYPAYGICERTFYNIMNATARLENPVVASDMPSLFDLLPDEPSDERKNDKY